MSSVIDSHIIEYHEDGTQTHTTIEHYTPPTAAEQKALLAVAVGVMVLPFVPLAVSYVSLKNHERRQRKMQKASLKAV